MALQTQDDDSAWAKAELESRFAQGHAEALRDAYECYGTLVYSYCGRAADSGSAVVLTRDTFVAGWKKRGQYDPRNGGLAPWLLGIARDKILEASPTTGTAASKTAATPSLATTLEDLALRMLLVDALEDLPEEAKRVTNMTFFEELGTVEIAAQTGLAPADVADVLRQSVDRLRHGLGYLHG